LASALVVAAAGFYGAVRGARERAPGGRGPDKVDDAVPLVSAAQPAPAAASSGIAGEWVYVQGELRFTCNGALKTGSLAGKRFMLQKSGAVMRFSDDSCSYDVSGDDHRVERKDGKCAPKQGAAPAISIVKHTVASDDGKNGRVSMTAEVTLSTPRAGDPFICQISGEGAVKKLGS
jgi:hypothetical protein